MLKSYLSVVLVTGLLFSQVFAEELNDTNALKELKIAKVMWDVTAENQTKLLAVLKIIQQTYDGLVRQKVTPEMVVLFRSDSVKLITVEHHHDHTGLEQHNEKVEITALLAELQDKPGVKMEVCGIAMAALNIESNTIFPGIKPVGNGFISLIGYHAQGYATIPIY